MPPTCTRYARTAGRRCTKDATDWPGHREALDQPQTDWPDLPRIVACWTHLRADERALCEEARRRYRQEGAAFYATRREQEEQETAARRAAGIPDPEPDVYQPPEPRPCINQCINRQAAGTSDSDSALMTCENCDGYLCVGCGTTPVARIFEFCRVCSDAIPDWTEEDDPDDEIDYDAPFRLRPEINALVTQIVNSGGPNYPQVQATLNRHMGIRQRNDATTEQLHQGLDYARQWLSRLRENPPSAPQHGPGPRPRPASPAESAASLLALADRLVTTSDPMPESVLLNLAYAVDSITQAVDNFLLREHPEVLETEHGSKSMTDFRTTLYNGARFLEAVALGWGAEADPTRAILPPQ